MEFGYFTLSDNHYENNPRDAEPVRRRHHRRGALRRPARHAFGLDRRASFQLARRAVLPRPGAGLYRGAHQAHPARARGHRAAAAPSDPRRRAMGDARPALRRPRRFRRRPRLRPRANTLPFHVVVRGQPEHLRGGHGGRPQAVGAPTAASRITASTTSSTTCAITPKPVQKPMPAYVGSFSKPSIELAARLGCGLIVAPFAAAMSYGGLQAGRRPLPRDLRQARHASRAG